MLMLSLLGGHFFVTNVAASVDQNASTDKVASNLREHASAARNETASVILQLNGPASGRLSALLNRNGIHVKQLFKNFNASAVDLPLNVIDELTSYDEVQFVSSDDQVISTGHVSSTTGADDVRTQTTSAGAGYTLDGTGVGIAIVDSGIYSDHKSLGARVIYSQDFTGENRVDDKVEYARMIATVSLGVEAKLSIRMEAPDAEAAGRCKKTLELYATILRAAKELRLAQELGASARIDITGTNTTATATIPDKALVAEYAKQK